MDLYLDCRSGISGDMILGALVGLGADQRYVEQQKALLGICGENDAAVKKEHGHSHRGFKDITDMISGSGLDEDVAGMVKAIYSVIAAAEARVHKASPETVHFHEVGRDGAILNMTGTAAALKSLDIKNIYCSEIHDGQGRIRCSHGVIPVPVPAVAAMMEECSYRFASEEIQTEMVTPTGLAVLIGTGAEYTETVPEERSIIRKAVCRGTRQTGKKGLEAFLFDSGR